MSSRSCFSLLCLFRLAQEVTSSAGPAIRVTTTEIALDLVVRDKKGRLVKNVKPGDIEISEDGVRQQVLGFRMVSGREQQSRPGSQTKPQTTPSFVPLRELNTVSIVFYNIDPVTRPHAVNIAKEFLKSNLPPESYIGIFNLNERLIPVHEFTKDRQELLALHIQWKSAGFLPRLGSSAHRQSKHHHHKCPSQCRHSHGDSDYRYHRGRGGQYVDRGRGCFHWRRSESRTGRSSA